MPGPILKPRQFPMPAALRGLVESVFPPDDLGLQPPMMGVLGKAATPAVKGLAGVTPDLVERTPVKQIIPSMDDVGALLGDMKRNMARVPQGQASIAPRATGGLREASPGSPLYDRLEGAAYDAGTGQANEGSNQLISQYLEPWLAKLRR